MADYPRLRGARAVRDRHHPEHRSTALRTGRPHDRERGRRHAHPPRHRRELPREREGLPRADGDRGTECCRRSLQRGADGARTRRFYHERLRADHAGPDPTCRRTGSERRTDHHPLSSGRDPFNRQREGSHAREGRRGREGHRGPGRRDKARPDGGHPPGRRLPGRDGRECGEHDGRGNCPTPREVDRRTGVPADHLQPSGPPPGPGSRGLCEGSPQDG